MPAVRYARVVGGPLKTNSYVISAGGQGLVVDPGVEPGKLLEAVWKLGVEEVPYVLLTHGHFDHVYFAAEVSEKLGAAVLVHSADLDLMLSAGLWGAVFYRRRFRVPERVELVRDGDVLRAGEVEARIIHTPGHTPGSVCILAGSLLITGDTLFKGAVGATIFPGGSRERLEESLARLASLPGDYTVLPGHGEETSLERERRSNPFLKGRGE
ncbi:MAG: MBL fold metallo-hydrolase [Thermofilum sp.]